MKTCPCIEVFVSSRCPFALGTHRVLEKLRNMRPDIEFQVIDIEKMEMKLPTGVFSTPTWMYCGKVISVGNPDPLTFIQSIGACPT